MEIKSLDLLNKGQKGKVIKVNSQGAVRRRIMDMGIMKGVELEVQGIAPFGDPLEVRVSDYNLTLRRNEAVCVLVEVI